MFGSGDFLALRLGCGFVPDGFVLLEGLLGCVFVLDGILVDFVALSRLRCGVLSNDFVLMRRIGGCEIFVVFLLDDCLKLRWFGRLGWKCL